MLGFFSTVIYNIIVTIIDTYLIDVQICNTSLFSMSAIIIVLKNFCLIICHLHAIYMYTGRHPEQFTTKIILNRGQELIEIFNSFQTLPLIHYRKRTFFSWILIPKMIYQIVFPTRHHILVRRLKTGTHNKLYERSYFPNGRCIFLYDL